MPGWFLQRTCLLFLLLGLRSSAASNLLTSLLLDRSPRGIERRIHIRTRLGIRVGDGDVPEFNYLNDTWVDFPLYQVLEDHEASIEDDLGTPDP